MGIPHGCLSSRRAFGEPVGRKGPEYLTFVGRGEVGVAPGESGVAYLMRRSSLRTERADNNFKLGNKTCGSAEGREAEERET